MSAEASCQQCGACASFGSEFHICMNTRVPVESIVRYKPIGTDSAVECPGFQEGPALNFSEEHLDIAEAASIDPASDEVDLGRMRGWVLGAIRE